MTSLPIVPTQKPARIRLETVMPAGLLNMFTLGASTTLYGPSLIYIAQETAQPIENLGALFAFHWAGFFAATLTANRLARKFEMRRGLLLGVALILLGVFGLISLPFPINLSFPLLIGLGSGTCEVLFNRLAETLADDKPAHVLARLHSTWGIGAIIVPLIIAAVALLGWNWRIAGIFVLVVGLLDLLLIARWNEFPFHHGGDIRWRSLPWRSLLYLLAIIVVYAGLEVAAGSWAAPFFALTGQGALLGSVATSGFYLTMSLGRVLLSAAPDRLGFARTLRLGTLASIGALLLTFIPSLAVIGFVLLGFFMSMMFPALLAWAPRRHPEIRAQMMSLSLAATGIGGVILPFLIGISVGAIGAWTLTPILIFTAALVAAMTLLERDTAS